MILKIFSVRDNVLEAYQQPFFAMNEGSAIRSLTEVVNDPKHPFAIHSNDYTLWFIGHFDDANGVILPAEPTRLLKLADLLRNPV